MENSRLVRKLHWPNRLFDKARLRGELVGLEPHSLTIWLLVRVRPAPPRNRLQSREILLCVEIILQRWAGGTREVTSEPRAASAPFDLRRQFGFDNGRGRTGGGPTRGCR